MNKLNNILKKYQNYETVNIIEIVKNFGLEIIEFDLGNINGILYKKTIGVNSKLNLKEKRFVLAHELCHYILEEKSFSTGIYEPKHFIKNHQKLKKLENLFFLSFLYKKIKNY